MDEPRSRAVDIQHVRRLSHTGVDTDGAIEDDLGLVSYPEPGLVGIGRRIKNQFAGIHTVHELALASCQRSRQMRLHPQFVESVDTIRELAMSVRYDLRGREALDFKLTERGRRSTARCVNAYGHNLIKSVKVATGGRPAERWELV